MNELRPIPLRADPDALREQSMRSLARAALVTARRVREPGLRKSWRNDADVELILRAPVSPASTTGSDTAALAQIKTAFIAALTPVSAAAQVIARSLQLGFDGATQIGIPELTMPNAQWVREGAPIPVMEGRSTPGPMIEPCRLASITSLSNEMMARSNAEAVIRQLLVENTAPVIDAAMFSATAGVPDLSPPGLLNGVAPLAASTATGYDAMVEDVGNIAQALAPVSGAGQAIIVCAPKQAVALGMAARDPLSVLSSAALAPGTVVGLVPEGLVSVVEAPRLDASSEATLHMNDAPEEIVDSGGTVASGPTINVYQADSTALRLILPATWALRSPAAVAWVQGTSW